MKRETAGPAPVAAVHRHVRPPAPPRLPDRRHRRRARGAGRRPRRRRGDAEPPCRPTSPTRSSSPSRPTGTTEYLGQDLTPGVHERHAVPLLRQARLGEQAPRCTTRAAARAGISSPARCPVCDTSVDPAGDNPNGASTGFADLNNPRNPFRDWNVVFVSYCSCDVHFGDAAQDYPPHVEHRGYHNSRIVEKWAREHFVEPGADLRHRLERRRLRRLVQRAAAPRGVAGVALPGPGRRRQRRHHRRTSCRTSSPNWNFRKNIPPDIPGRRRGRSTTAPASSATPRRSTELLPADALGALHDRLRRRPRRTDRLLQHHAERQQPDRRAHLVGGQLRVQRADARAGDRPPPPRCRRTTATTSAPARGTRCGAATRSTPTRRAACRPSSTGSTRMLDGTPAWTNVECAGLRAAAAGRLAPEPAPAAVLPGRARREDHLRRRLAERRVPRLIRGDRHRGYAGASRRTRVRCRPAAAAPAAQSNGLPRLNCRPRAA